MKINTRRLSKNADGLLDIEQDEFESTNLSPFGGLGRRKSSIGPSMKSPAKGSVEFAKQEELAEKYRMIIKLSTENVFHCLVENNTLKAHTYEAIF